jgi:hypothetical protein
MEAVAAAIVPIGKALADLHGASVRSRGAMW